MINHTSTGGFQETVALQEQGYTLIEVLIAITIFAIGMLAVASMQLGATQGTSVARSNTELAAFATDQMERLSRLPFDDPDLTAGQHNANAPNDPRFSAIWVIADNEIVMDTKTVTMTATEDLRGNIRALTLQNVIPRQ